MITSRPRGRFFTVSLFTREWIEILKNFIVSLSILVSLFTREWIEMATAITVQSVVRTSSSLRGSGLKCSGRTTHECGVVCLPLYEGVD